MKRLVNLARFLILALAVFFAVFSPEVTLEDTMINLIPSVVLILLLLSSIWWKKVATFLLLIVGIVFTLFFSTYDYYLKFLVISLPLFAAFLIFLFQVVLSDEGNDQEEDYEEEDEDIVDYADYDNF